MLITKTTTNSLWVFRNHQNQSQKQLSNPENVEVPFNKRPTRSLFFSVRFNTISFTRIPAISSLSTTSNPRITDYNAEICKFCEMGNLQKAMDLVAKSGKSNIESKTYCNILELCADLKALNHGKEVHLILCSEGIEIDSILGAKLVFMYVRCGDFTQGRLAFDEIRKAKVLLWNFMMNEYAKIGDFEESILLFKKMQEIGVDADSYTFSCLFKCVAALGSVMEGESVHGYVLKLGFAYYDSVLCSMISLYFKFGRTDSAHKLFDDSTDRDVITWNSMISGYVANGLAEKGVEIFKEMLDSGTRVDLVTMVSVLAACANIGTISLGKAVHAYALKGEFDKKTKFKNTLLDMYSKCGDTNAAVRVFENMDERNVVTWTSMIAGYARQGQSDKAIDLFLEMKREGIKPDKFVVSSVLHACASNGSLEKGKELHDYIKENHIQSLSVSNALMDMYAKCGSVADANSVFNEMPHKDIISWNTMIGGYSKNCLPSEALDLFVEMQCKVKPDNVTMTSILPACASLAALDKGREIHAHILRNGFSSDRYVMNALVDMYVKCGALVLAKSLFDKTNVKDLVTWTVMIAGYGMHGFGTEAVSTFTKMHHEGIEPDDVSFTSILYACSHSGLLDEGWKFYNIMKNDCKIEPKLEHYACMVDLLSRVGKLSVAYEFIKVMPVKPDATIWGALLCGCRIHHDVKLAEKVAEKVFELEPENTGYYVLLANIYAEAEKWEEVKKLRHRIGQRGLRKNPGCSWIEIRGKVNIFVAGGKEHPEAKEIEALLEKLRTKMKEEGYSPKLKYALVDGDEMEREAALCGHSEKLAMAFGILNLPPGKTIRVTKNLRICGDCHEMAKFISKTVGRQIVLRDSNRFHHFKDGSCSCRGYW